MLLIIIAVVVFLLFVTAVIFSVRSWKWFHITMCFLVYITANFLVVMTARALKPRMTWMASVKKHEDVLVKSRDLGSRLASGDLTEVAQTEPNLRMLEARIGRVTTRRGRVWRRLKKGQVSPAQVIVNGETPEPLGFDGQLQSIVYLFRETPHNQLTVDKEKQIPFTVPTCYLGEFKVTAAAGNQVTLVPTQALDRNIIASLAAAGTLAIYETMPIDGHRLFSLQDSLIEPFTDENKPLFGPMDKNIMDKVFLMAVAQSYLDNPKVANIPGKVEELNKDYLRDGKAPVADDIERDRWMKVRFTTAPADGVPVDSEEEQLNFDTRPFDTNGRAISSALRRGEDVKFKENDIAVFHRPTAMDFINKQECTQIHEIYVRPLEDYEHSFHRIVDRKQRIGQEYARVQRDMAKTVVTDTETQRQIKFREAEKVALLSDRDYHKRDLDEINALKLAYEAKHKKLLTELAALHQRTRFLASEIERVDKQRRDRIEGVAEPAAASGDTP